MNPTRADILVAQRRLDERCQKLREELLRPLVDRTYQLVLAHLEKKDEP